MRIYMLKVEEEMEIQNISRIRWNVTQKWGYPKSYVIQETEC